MSAADPVLADPTRAPNHASSEPRTLLLVAAGGAALLGACLGLRGGLESTLARAVGLPVVVFGVALAAAPTLYVGAALLGSAPPAREFRDAALRALRDMGVLMAGLAPAALLLLASLHTIFASGVVAFALLGLTALFGLRSFFVAWELDPATARRLGPLALGWVALVLKAGVDALDHLILY